MQQLLAQQRHWPRIFPSLTIKIKDNIIGSDLGLPTVSMDLACCCAALKTGSVDMLCLLFSRSAGSSGILGDCWQRKLMLQYAIRNSNWSV
jgi:hypothetical protein